MRSKKLYIYRYLARYAGNPVPRLSATIVTAHMFVHSLDVPFAFALFLSIHGFRKKSLSPDGALTAFAIGFGIMASAVKAYPIGLIILYLVGSRTTKIGKKQKARLEEGYHEAGYRTGGQVLCNSLCAFIGTALWNMFFVPQSMYAHMARGLGFQASVDGPMYAPGMWCPTDGSVGGGMSRLLYYIILGQLGSCLGDTLASELGMLSRSQPRMITTLKPVPRGTNGAITAEGTLWSIIGGVLVGSGMGMSVMIENGAVCGWGTMVESVGWGGVAGGIGSMIDSLLGATVQETVYNHKREQIVRNRTEGEIIGGRNVLSNSSVNLFSSTVVALLIGSMTSL